MNKSYQPQEIEQRLYERWEEQGYFAPQGNGEPYCIVIPPPNVTGTLHMGHAFQDTIMDTLTRFHRMKGHRTLWQPGMDHAGIATQMVVERLLNNEGTSKRDSVAKNSWNVSGPGKKSPVARSLNKHVDWARLSTGVATGSQWMKACRRRFGKYLCSYTMKVSFIAASASSTGTLCCTRRCRTLRFCQPMKMATSGISAIHWHREMVT